MRKFLLRHKLAVSLLLIGVIIFLLRFEILSAIGAFLVIDQPLARSDLIQAPGGENARIDYAVQIFKENYADRLLFSGSERVIPPTQSPYSKLIYSYVGEKGVPENVIFVRPASSTYEDATALRTFLLQKDLGSAIVTSSPYHMHRVKMTFNKVIPDDIKLIFRSVPWDMTNLQKKWWKDENSINFVVSEYIKLVYYLFRYII